MTRPILLDVTRLASRAGLRPTGVDRVEAAYLRRTISSEGPVFGLARTALGFVLLDRQGLSRLHDHISLGDWPGPDLISRLNRRLSPEAARGQSTVRALSVARCSRPRLPGFLKKRFPDGVDYYNVGHANLTPAALTAVPGRVTVLVHDVIPLTHPQFQRPGTVSAFKAKMSAVARCADRVICTTQSAQADIARHLGGKDARIMVAPIGIDPVEPQPDELPNECNLDAPFFVALGTIEPRKNIGMLLDIWDNWPGAPTLYLCGKRGWRNEDVFARLDAGVANVAELPGLSDGAIAALLSRAEALLFPSFAEGFGLPPAEALALGTRVICADLPACRDVLGNAAIYVDPSDRYHWESTVRNLSARRDVGACSGYSPPDWETHFKLVFTQER